MTLTQSKQYQDIDYLSLDPNGRITDTMSNTDNPIEPVDDEIHIVDDIKPPPRVKGRYKI